MCRNMLKHEEDVPNSLIHFRSNIFQRPKAGMVMRVEKKYVQRCKSCICMRKRLVWIQMIRNCFPNPKLAR